MLIQCCSPNWMSITNGNNSFWCSPAKWVIEPLKSFFLVPTMYYNGIYNSIKSHTHTSKNKKKKSYILQNSNAAEESLIFWMPFFIIKMHKLRIKKLAWALLIYTGLQVFVCVKWKIPLWNARQIIL